MTGALLAATTLLASSSAGALLDRYLGLGAAAVAVLGAAAALAALVPLVRMQRSQYVTEPLVPLPSQPVCLPAAGTLVLYVRGSRTQVWELDRQTVGLWDPVASEYVRSWDVAPFGTRSSGFATVQHARKQFEVPRAGEYILTVGGLEEGQVYENRLVFGTASPGKRLVLVAVLIVAAGASMFATIVARVLLR